MTPCRMPSPNNKKKKETLTIAPAMLSCDVCRGALLLPMVNVGARLRYLLGKRTYASIDIPVKREHLLLTSICA